MVTSVASAQEIKPNKYLKAGIPATSRIWAGTDYVQATTILISGKVQLPRMSDKDGLALINRITSLDNFALNRDRTLPLQIRFEDFINLHQSLSLLQKHFGEIDLKSNHLSDESASLMAYGLQSAALGMSLTDELLKAMPNAKQNVAAMDSLQKMRSNLTGMFVGAEMSLTKDGGYSVAARSTILSAMATTLIIFKESFEKDYRIELRMKLRAHRAHFNASKDLKMIDTMINELTI